MTKKKTKKNIVAKKDKKKLVKTIGKNKKTFVKKSKGEKKKQDFAKQNPAPKKTQKKKKKFWVDLKLAFFLAWKSIQRGNKSSLFLVIGIMMVVFLNLLFTDAIFAGIIKGVNDRKIDYQFGEILIEPKTGDEYITRSGEIIEQYKDDVRVVNIGKELKIQARFINEKEKDGRDFEDLGANLHNLGIKNVFDIESRIITGRMLKKDDFGKIIIGSAMAGGYPGAMTSEDLGSVRPGDKIIVQVGKAKKEFEIIGVYKTKNAALDKDALITDAEINSLIGDKNLASSIIVRLSDENYSKDFLTGFRQGQFRDYVISDWKENIAAGAGVSKSFEMIGLILRVIGALVAGLVIFIIIFVDIVNKRRQVGILKAIGINEKIVINSYIIRGVFYTILGSIFGYLIMEYGIIAAFSKKPIDLPMGDIVPLLKESALISSVLFFVLAGLIGSATPAYKEIKKKILDLLYH